MAPTGVQPLVDYVIKEFNNIDYNAEMTFDGVKLRAYIGELLAFTEKIKWIPKPSAPSTEVFIKECRVVPIDFDIMGMRGLVDRFRVWREERLPGVRAFQSTYDRVGVTVCKGLYQVVHDVHAISTLDYILPLMPELFRFAELHDNNELATRASTLMVRMCGVTPPLPLVSQILDAIFEARQKSPSWRIRLKALPLVQVFYFHQVLCKCLDDEVVEVREKAAITLSGILRLSPRRSVLTLKDRFVRLAKNSHIPNRQDPGYNKAIRQRHAAILGICALVDSYPYTVEKWMPELLTNILAEHTYDPIPISTTVRKCASDLKRTHQDTWHEDAKRFNEDQLAALLTLLTSQAASLYHVRTYALPIPTPTPKLLPLTHLSDLLPAATRIGSALLAAKSPLIITSFLSSKSNPNPHSKSKSESGSDAVSALQTLSSLLSIPVITVCPSTLSLPFSHPSFSGATYLAPGTHSAHLASADVILVWECNAPWIPANDVVGFLTGGCIPDYIKDLPTDCLSTPFGAALRPTIDAMYRRPPPSEPTPRIPSSIPAANGTPELAISILQAVAAHTQASNSTPNVATQTFSAPIHTITNPPSFHSK
ncbi:hypothetical protein D9615_010202 [Tricholomella constricta]|uniref:Proteasome activator complex subunit 4 C-terminal domain-containing protein n=1 Tax=Tricholomella constricta TaxID=117010 RepID=A0A8H5LSW3_9AGAR|nr:hypothetical protein D9615_010202 [Tricholomella constricta]